MKIKICGMKYPENITAAAGLQPDYLGFIFYDKSPRHFETMIPNLDDSIQKVGVFVNACLEEIEERVHQYQLDFVQLHGEESPEFCERVEQKSAKVIKVFNIHNEFIFNELEKYKNSCSYYLFDTKGAKYGGNGVSFDWDLLAQYQQSKPYFLSGGIGSETIDKLVSFLQKEASKNCQAIDLNSRFEIAPGLKNTTSLKEFIQNLKEKL